jgi:hypothetical protein
MHASHMHTHTTQRIFPLGGQHIAIDQDETEIVRTEYRLRSYINNTVSDVGNVEKANTLLNIQNKNFRHLTGEHSHETRTRLAATSLLSV